MTPDRTKILAELGRMVHGKVLKEYLEDELTELSDVKNCTSWEDTLGRQLATRTIKRLFSFLEFKDTTLDKSPNVYS